MAQRKPPHAMEVQGPPARRRPGPSLLRKACRAALGGGAPGAAAMVLQVLLLMWLRTTINIQLATGSGFFATMRHLYREGGVPRFYQGLWIALLSAPLARFGDTAANEGALALLEASALPVAAKTVVASCCAALWRIFIFPFDTVKTTLQVSGGAALRAKIAAGGLFSLYGGALGASFATLVGHYPWFATNNVLEGAVPDFGPRLKLARRALIGFVCSAVSDTVSNSIRVVKVYVQTSKVPIGYAAAVSEVLAARGLGGLLWSGLPAKLLCNGISSIVFSVAWKGLMERYKKATPPKRDDGEDVEPLLPR